ncbi:MAG: 23S rRNA (uracil(1939)-C(5))-methyltransferase RlmD [Salinisphaera sp.]|nr:23S rRNA (uracil(1939)-C(5))-methyltransferase RlmD [Salinisphaera sp.]
MATEGELDIDDLAADSSGVGCDAQGKRIFVPGALPGERVGYRVLRRRRKRDEAELAALLRPSLARVDPRCAHFGVCGGCALQHLEPQAQVEHKQQHLFSTLERIGGVISRRRLAPITGARWGYRRRARLGVKRVAKKGTTLVGFRERRSPFVAVLDACHTLVPEVGMRLPELRELVDGLSIRERLPQIEVAAGDNGTALVLRVLAPPSAADRQRLLAFAQDTGLWLYLQPGGPASVARLQDASPALWYDLPEFDARIGFAPTDFVQIHAEVNAHMVSQALRLLDPGADDRVLELFSGIGNFTLPLARRAGRVTAVEGEADMVMRAAANARSNGLDNVDSRMGDLFLAPAQDKPWGAADLVLLDPPRPGALEVLPAGAASGARRVVYCSCHPATLARDAALLVRKYGYDLEAAGLVDMFPHTGHAEAMALFTR